MRMTARWENIAIGLPVENEEHRKELVNLTIWDYCNRIKTFAKK